MNKTPARIANIGPAQTRQRLVGAWLMLAVSVVLVIVLIVGGVPRLWRAVVFAPLLASTIGFFQVKEHTCVKLAARGTQHMDEAERPVEDPAALRQMRRQARTVWLESVVLALLLTAVVVVFPGKR